MLSALNSSQKRLPLTVVRPEPRNICKFRPIPGISRNGCRFTPNRTSIEFSNDNRNPLNANWRGQSRAWWPKLRHSLHVWLGQNRAICPGRSQLAQIFWLGRRFIFFLWIHYAFSRARENELLGFTVLNFLRRIRCSHCEFVRKTESQFIVSYTFDSLGPFTCVRSQVSECETDDCLKFLFQINLILVEWRLSRTIHRSHSHLLMLMDWLFTLTLAVRKPAEVWSMNRTSVRYRLVSRLGFCPRPVECALRTRRSFWASEILRISAQCLLNSTKYSVEIPYAAIFCVASIVSQLLTNRWVGPYLHGVLSLRFKILNHFIFPLV